MTLEQQMETVSRRFEELTQRLNQPDAAADPAPVPPADAGVSRGRAGGPGLPGLADRAGSPGTGKSPARRRDALEPDFKAMVQQEICEKAQSAAKLENSLKLLLLPKDEYDGRSVIVEIRSGVGGEEAALFARSLLRMYTMYAQSRRWQLDLLNLSETELGGVREAVFCGERPGGVQPAEI